MALESMGAAPQTPGVSMPVPMPAPMPVTPVVDAKSGIKRLGELGGERQAATAAYDKQSSDLQGRMAKENASAAGLPLPKLDAIDKPFEHKGMSGEELTSAMQTMFAFAAIGGAMTRAPMASAMKSFASALQGFQQGDQVLFQREGQEFDRNLRVAMAKNQQAMNEYSAAFQKHKGNAQDLMNEWSILAKKHGDTVAATSAERSDIQGMLRHIEAQKKLDQQMGQQQQNFNLMIRRQEETERHNRAGEVIAAEKNAIKEKAAALGGKPSATERQHYMDSNALLKSVGRIEGMLADPEIRAKIDSSRVGNYLSDAVESKALQTFLVRPNLDPDVKAYLTEVANLRNQYYLDMSGKAVTGGEALRNFGAVVQPLDSAEDVLRKMQIASTRSREKMNDLETYFPSLKVVRGAPRPGATGDFGGAGATPPPPAGFTPL